MRSPEHARIPGLPGLVLLILIAGCSASPLSPVQKAYSTHRASSKSVQLSADSKVVSGTIDGAVGGVLRNGDWTVRIPAGSFAGVGLVTVVVPDPAVRSCQLGIVPSVLNSFQAPVSLSCRLQSQEEVRTFEMERWDPSTGAWTAVDSKTDSKALSCDAALPHFSTYRCGKAG